MIRGDLSRPFEILELETVDSTNAEAQRQVAAGVDRPLWITARAQTEGRGRRGRVWESDPEDLKATLLIGLDMTPAEAALLSFVAGLAVADMAAETLPPEEVRLKWPNDVMAGGEKLAGVLIESGRTKAGALWAAAGIGVNLVSAPVGLERPATSMRRRLGAAAARTPDRRAALAALDAAFRGRLAAWARDGRAAVIQAFEARAFGLPGPCVARLPEGEIRGYAEGLDADGALRLRLADGAMRLISAGDVFFGAQSEGR